MQTVQYFTIVQARNPTHVNYLCHNNYGTTNMILDLIL